MAKATIQAGRTLTGDPGERPVPGEAILSHSFGKAACLVRYRLEPDAEVVLEPSPSHRVILLSGRRFTLTRGSDGRRSYVDRCPGLITLQPSGRQEAWSWEGQPLALGLGLRDTWFDTFLGEIPGVEPAEVALSDAFMVEDPFVWLFCHGLALCHEARNLDPLALDQGLIGLACHVASQYARGTDGGELPARWPNPAEFLDEAILIDFRLDELADALGIGRKRMHDAFVTADCERLGAWLRHDRPNRVMSALRSGGPVGAGIFGSRSSIDLVFRLIFGAPAAAFLPRPDEAADA